MQAGIEYEQNVNVIINKTWEPSNSVVQLQVVIHDKTPQAQTVNSLINKDSLRLPQSVKNDLSYKYQQKRRNLFNLFSFLILARTKLV